MTIINRFSDFKISKMDDLEVILKITEVCNIDCTYCYVFNRGNDDYKSRPARMSATGLQDIIEFLRTGIEELTVKRVRIVFHGGEPLVLGTARFESMCRNLFDSLSELVDLSFGIQTNAMLITESWIEIFERFNISVGVSIDGPREINDVERVDKRGRGSHSRVLKGIELLRAAYNAERIPQVGAICVINPKYSAFRIYEHLAIELGFKNISFNLPMHFFGEPVDWSEDQLAFYLRDLFNAWQAHNDRTVKIRLIDQMLRYFAGDSKLHTTLTSYLRSHLMVVISSDGDLSEHDDYKIINFAQRMGNVKSTRLVEFANSPLRAFLDSLLNSVPHDCRKCDWRNYCKAGMSHGLGVSRYSESNGFDNKSTLCHGFQALFESGAKFLLQSGVEAQTIEHALGIGKYEGRYSELSVPTIPDNSFTLINA